MSDKSVVVFYVYTSNELNIGIANQERTVAWYVWDKNLSMYAAEWAEFEWYFNNIRDAQTGWDTANNDIFQERARELGEFTDPDKAKQAIELMGPYL